MLSEIQNTSNEEPDLSDLGTTPGVSLGIVYFYGAVAFLVGLFRNWTIPLIGMMPVGELLLAAVLGHAVIWLAISRRLPAPLPSPALLSLFLTCQLLAFAGYIVSDLWRESASVDMLRGWLRMVFIFIDIVALAFMFGAGRRSFFWMMLGASFSGFQSLVIPPLFNEYWKFGFGYPLTVLVILIVPRFFGFWALILGCLLMGVVHTVLDFRSLGAICLGLGMANMLFVLPKQVRKLLAIVVFFAVVVSAPWTVSKMFADTEGRANRSNVERAAMLQAAMEAIVESPLIGHGSWFSNSKVMDNFLIIRAQRARAAGGGLGFADDNSEGVAIHSQILVTLAEGGLLGGAFFAVYAAFICWGLWFCFVESPWTWLTPVRLFILFTSLWDVWMSAFTGPIRVNIAMTAVVILVLWAERKSLRTARRERGGGEREPKDVLHLRTMPPHTATPET